MEGLKSVAVSAKHVLAGDIDALKKQGQQPLASSDIIQRAEDEKEHEQYELEHGYVRARLAQYPPVGNQLDAIMKWLATQSDFNIPQELRAIALKCMSVKTANPKPEPQNGR